MPDDKNIIEPINADFDAVAKAMTKTGDPGPAILNARYGGILAIGDVPVVAVTDWRILWARKHFHPMFLVI